METVVELHMRKVCDTMSLCCVVFLRSSKHNSHIEGICLLVNWIAEQKDTIVTRL